MKEHWNDEEYAKRMFDKFDKKPNVMEQNLLAFLKDIDSDWEFVGDGAIWIAGRNPDFINKRTHKLVEFFGKAWHKESDEDFRKNHFSNHGGWECFVLWSQEKKNPEKLKELVEFCYAQKKSNCYQNREKAL